MRVMNEDDRKIRDAFCLKRKTLKSIKDKAKNNKDNKAPYSSGSAIVQKGVELFETCEGYFDQVEYIMDLIKTKNLTPIEVIEKLNK